MTTEELRGAPGFGSGLPLLHALSTFWGLAVLLGLASYTLLDAMRDEPIAASATVRQQSSPLLMSPTIASVSTSGPYPAIQPEPMVIFLACNQEDASFDRISNRPPPGRYPFTMRLDQVPNDVRALLNGTDTTFPKDARISKTSCIQAMIDAGTLP